MEQIYGIQVRSYTCGEWETMMISKPIVFKTEEDARGYIDEKLHETINTRYKPVLMTIFNNKK